MLVINKRAAAPSRRKYLPRTVAISPSLPPKLRECPVSPLLSSEDTRDSDYSSLRVPGTRLAECSGKVFPYFGVCWKAYRKPYWRLQREHPGRESENEPHGEFGLFKDRHDAGAQLAQRLLHYRGAKDTIVIGLPRGGVVVAYDISLTLRRPLDVFITRKLGTPENPELAMGAPAETGYQHLNEDVIRGYGVSAAQLEEEIRHQKNEIDRMPKAEKMV